MRRTTLILLLVLETAGLFVFENLHALFRQLENRERSAYVTQSAVIGRLLVKAHGANAAAMRASGLFSHVALETAVSGPLAGATVVQLDGRPVVQVRVPLPPARRVLLRRPLLSTSLNAMSAARKIMTGVILALAVFLLVTAWRLLASYRRPRGEAGADPIHPFQGYLAELHTSQRELQEMVSEQARAAGRGEELNRSIIQNIHLAVMMLNPAGRIETVNPAGLSLFNRSFAQIKNEAAGAMFGDFPPLLDFITRGGGRQAAEIDCGERIFFADLIPLHDGSRLALVREISDEKKRERVQLIQANLIMLGEMAAALAHETRNSLGVILGYAKSGSLDEERSRRIVREVNFLTDMMERFLDFSRPVRSGERRATDLRPLLADLAAANGLELELPHAPLQLESDPALLNSIFSNLLRNAREAGARRVHVALPRSAPLTIEFADDGPGIAADLRGKIWLPFFSTRDKGSGMGLPLVKKLVTVLNGEIELLESDRGAVFRIVFY